MHIYTDDCSFTWTTIYEQVDHYFAIHWFNWILATFVLRDPYIIHFWHIFDEVIELSWQHILPHFGECWFDHIFMDIFFANIPAAILGMWMLRKCGIQEYDWLGRKGKDSWRDWDIWYCHRRLGGVAYMIFLLNIHFVVGFFLTNQLHIPNKHMIPVIRLIFWFLYGNVGYKEGWEDVSTWNTHARKHNPVEGRYRFMCVGIFLLEVALVYKYREGSPFVFWDAETPLYISLPWAMFYGGLFVYWLYLRFFYKYRTKKYLEEGEIDPRLAAIQAAKVKKAD